MTFVQSGAATMNGKRNRKWSMISREKIDALCVKNATKTKIGLRAYCLAGLPFSPLNNAFFGFVALSHVLKNELKSNPLKSRLIRGVFGVPERIRTFDPQSRSLILYPAELRAQVLSCQILACNHRSRSLILYPAELRAQTICSFFRENARMSGQKPGKDAEAIISQVSFRSNRRSPRRRSRRARA